MPARKRNLVLLSHREAVDLAPDSADKRAVMECANARFVLLNGDITDQNLRMLVQLQQDVALMPARASDDTQRLRILAFGLRLTGQVSRLRKERDQIMEAAFRFARIAHYRQTGVRVGDLFDPIAEQADQEPARAESNGGPIESNGGPIANAQGSKPASNRQIKEYLHYLKRHRVNGDTRENFRRRAQAEGWDKSRLSIEAHKLTAA